MPDLGLSAVLPEMMRQPALFVIILLSAGTLFMNGAHDAANAIATTVATRSMRPGWALFMAAICNFLGVSLSTLISTAVAQTMLSMVNFSGNNEHALIALAAAMIAVIAWGGITWALGIPTSQSHALIAGITGSAIALQNGLAGVNGGEWMKVIWGLVVATGLGFGLGYLFWKIVAKLFKYANYRVANRRFGYAQSVLAGLLAFLHGSQDGQKFMSICVLGVTLALGGSVEDSVEFPLWIMIMCSLCMCVGTAIGGKKIIRGVGANIVKLEKWEGFVVTAAASLCVWISNITGLPISTTQTNTTAIMGSGAAHHRKSVNWNVGKNMVLAWVYTFPGCGLAGYVLAKIFLVMF